jgi:cysteine-rich repeat protein
MRFPILRSLLVCVVALCPTFSSAAPGEVIGERRIASGESGFTGPLESDDWFGFSVNGLGDFDGDGVEDLVVGAGFDDDGGLERGAVWILFLNADGTVKAEHKISSLTGGFAGPLADGDVFGRAVASIGDLDGDGIGDIAVGSRQDNDGGSDRGAVWILFLNANATVKSAQKISSTQGGLVGPLTNGGWFGISLDSIGDLDGDGNVDLVVGQVFDAGGAVWILFLNSDGTVKDEHKIQGNTLAPPYLFGESVSSVGDVDGDGVGDIGVTDIEGTGSEKGAAWILFLNTDGSLKDSQKISSTEGGFTGVLDPYDHMGSAIEGIGDIDGDGTPDIAVGSDLNDDGATNAGAVWIMFLESDGTVRAHTRISQTSGGFGGSLASEDRFGRSIAAIGDLNDDSMLDLAIGTIFHNGAGSNDGAVWLTFLDTEPLGPTTTTTTLPPVCGDAQKGGLEECDDGNQDAGDGCSETCTCESTPDADSDGIGDLCDSCPTDSGNDADSDGLCAGADACPLDPQNDSDDDGTCDDVDNCDDAANADQADADLDGVGDACDSCPGFDDGEDGDEDGYGDACDLCTNVDGGQDIDIKAVGWFRSIALLGPLGNETFDFSGEFRLPDGSDFTVIDPLTTPVHLRVERDDGVEVIDVEFPTVSAEAGVDGGWRTNGRTSRWHFRSTQETPPGGIFSLRIEDRSKRGPRQVRVKIRGENGFYDLPFGTEPFRVTVVVGNPAEGHCGETSFNARGCAYYKKHVSLVCK